MATVVEHAPGAPSWVDLSSPDMEGSKAFYNALFGWEAHETPDPAAGGYTMFTLNGREVAGVGPIFNPQQPPAWSTYIATADAEATANAVRDAGGTVVMGPMDVMQAGRLAVLQDPTGAFLGVWEPGEHRGAQVMDEPGSFCWTELNTRDMATARQFYREVFGWDTLEHPGPNGDAYTEWRLDGRSVGGGFDMTRNVPDQVPPHWLAHFAIEDCDASAQKARDLGGEVLVGPMDVDRWRFAVIRDPQGAQFAILQSIA